MRALEPIHKLSVLICIWGLLLNVSFRSLLIGSTLRVEGRREIERDEREKLHRRIIYDDVPAKGCRVLVFRFQFGFEAADSLGARLGISHDERTFS